jgi:hypothetical protein
VVSGTRSLAQGRPNTWFVGRAQRGTVSFVPAICSPSSFPRGTRSRAGA